MVGPVDDDADLLHPWARRVRDREQGQELQRARSVADLYARVDAALDAPSSFDGAGAAHAITDALDGFLGFWWPDRDDTPDGATVERVVVRDETLIVDGRLWLISQNRHPFHGEFGRDGGSIRVGRPDQLGMTFYGRRLAQWIEHWAAAGYEPADVIELPPRGG
jgi:hypothetical protein